MGEIQNLSKDINFNNLTYYFKGNSNPKIIIGFKGQLGFYKNIKEGYTILEKAEENKNNNKIRSKWNSQRKLKIWIRRAKKCNKKIINSLQITRKSYQIV